MPQFFNHFAHSALFMPNTIQLALKEINFEFHRTNSSLAIIEDHNSNEQIILSTEYGSEDSRCASPKHIPLLMAANTPSGRDEGELRCSEQQTELVTPAAGVHSPVPQEEQTSSPVPTSDRPPSILSSVRALLLAKQAPHPKEEAVSERASTICRICYGGSSRARLLRPCACRGTVAAVHRACLERWLRAAATSRCELCRHHYVVTRRHKWSLWRSVWEWGVSGGGRALAADAARGVLLGAAAALGTARALHAADALLHAAAAGGGLAALAANVLSSVIIGIIGALNGLLTTWVLLKIQEHQAAWRAWRDSTVLVRVALDEPPPTDPPMPPPTTTSSAASFGSAASSPPARDTDVISTTSSPPDPPDTTSWTFD